MPGPRGGARSICQGFQQGQDPAESSAGTNMQVQECLSGGLNKGKIQPMSVQGPRCGLRNICWGISQGHELVDSVQGRDGGSEVVVGGLAKGRTQPGSGQRVRYGISDTLAWKLPGAEEPGRLHSMRSVRA